MMQTTTSGDSLRSCISAREFNPSGAAIPVTLLHQITLILEDPQSTFGEKIAGIEKEILLDTLEKNGWVKILAAREVVNA